MGQTRGFFGRSRRMLRAKTVTCLRTESGLSALSSSWTYVAGQKGDVSRHRARSRLSSLVHLGHVGRTVVFLTFLRTECRLYLRPGRCCGPKR